MFGAYQITLSNAVISCEDFRVAIDKRTFQCQFGNVTHATIEPQRVQKIQSYIDCERVSHIEIVDI